MASQEILGPADLHRHLVRDCRIIEVLKKKKAKEKKTGATEPERTRDYRLHRFFLESPQGLGLDITLAFPFDGPKTPRRTMLASEKVYSFTPLICTPTRLPFAIHTDWDLTSDRRALSPTSSWNEYVLQVIPHLFVQACKSDPRLSKYIQMGMND